MPLSSCIWCAAYAVIMGVVENLVKFVWQSGVCVFTHIKLRGGLKASAGERDLQKVPSVFLT